MTNMFIKPEELDDRTLMYWAAEHEKRYIASLEHADHMRDLFMRFQNEKVRRGL